MSNYCVDIFEYVKQQKAAYKLPIRLNESWEWSMYEHLLLSELYTNAQLRNGKNDYTPVKNITLPNLNLQHWTEDVDEKDVQIYVNDDSKYHLSLLVKKYHDEVFVKKNDLDTYFDELKNSRIDLGAGLSKKLFKARPEMCSLFDIVFCSQKNILSAPFAFEHDFSPDELLDMQDRGWGNKTKGATHTVEELITMWREQEKEEDCLKILEVHGTFPARYADPEAEEYKYETRIFIISFIRPKDATENKGIILYTAEEKISEVFKITKRDPIHGRALGRGGAEELFEPQVWTNYDVIRMQNLLDAASATILQTTDPTLAAKHPKGLKHLKNLELITKSPNTELGQVDTFPRNLAIFDRSIAEWQQHAKELSGAQDPLQGVAPTAGTPFKSYDAQVQQGMGLHKERRKQFARHIEEIYKDWIIPHIKKEITNGFNFLATLSVEEMQYVADRMATNAWSKFVVNKILEGGEFVEGEQQAWIEQWKFDFKKGGNKRFLDVLKGELKDVPISVAVTATTSNISEMADKITNIWRFMFANPQGFAQVMQIPGMASNFNKLLEFSGMTPADFSGIEKMIMAQAQPSPREMLPESAKPVIA